MSGALLTAGSLRRVFPVRRGFGRARGEIVAVDDVSLDVPRGSVLGIVGGSGSGKSTLARILLGLDAPSSGSVRLGGRPLHEMGRMELADSIQPVFQDPYLSLNPRKSIASIISLPLRIRKVAHAEVQRRVGEVMELTGLQRRLADAFPGQLSGGQRQRVAIARALVSRPQIVVCDEPTSALDVSIQAQILNLLQDLRRELGLTYILISHNLAVVEHIATDVIVMHRGKVVEQGPCARIFAAPQAPYTMMLLASILTPEPGKGLPELLPDEDGAPGDIRFRTDPPVPPHLSPASDPKGRP